MKNLFNYIRYSGLWVGIVFNPFHWKFGWDRSPGLWPQEYLYENCVYFGPVYIRLIIDDGSW